MDKGGETYRSENLKREFCVLDREGPKFIALENIHSMPQRSVWIINVETTNRKGIIHHIIKHDKKLLNWSLKQAI